MKGPQGARPERALRHCGLSWHKYADLDVFPIHEEPLVKNNSNVNGKAAAGDRHEGTPLNGQANKHAKVGPSSEVRRCGQCTDAATQTVSSNPTPPPAVSQIRCVCCQRMDPAGKVLRCMQCQFCVQAGVCGVTPNITASDSWMCDLCQNENP